MVSIKEGIEKILAQKIALKTKIIPLENANNSICSKTLYANISLPRFDNSAMDGYALRGNKKKYKIIGKILAGDDKYFDLKDGECVKITTGAKTPKSVDCVIPQENCKIFKDEIEVVKAVKFGANIRKEGEDIKTGEVIINKGDKITSNFIQLLSSQGVTHIEVYQTPRVAIFASGSELKMPYEKLNSAQIYNSNTPYLISRVKELGCKVDFVGKSEDSLEGLKAMVENSLSHDIIITSGGVSVGEADFTKEAFNSFGFEPIFEKVKIKPGKPTTFGKIRNTFVLNLPGNPLAASLNFEIFGRVLINHLSGINHPDLKAIKARLDQNFSKNKPVATVIPGFFNGEYFQIAKKFGPNMVNVLNHCNGFIIIDEKINEIKKDEIVDFFPINL